MTDSKLRNNDNDNKSSLNNLMGLNEEEYNVSNGLHCQQVVDERELRSVLKENKMIDQSLELKRIKGVHIVQCQLNTEGIYADFRIRLRKNHSKLQYLKQRLDAKSLE